MKEKTLITYAAFLIHFNRRYNRHVSTLLRPLKNLSRLEKKILSQFLYQKGKRLRPYLIYMGYRLAREEKPPSEVIDLAIVYEDLHSYAKLRDTLIDRFHEYQDAKSMARLALAADLFLMEAHAGFSHLSPSIIQTLKDDWSQVQKVTWQGEYKELFQLHFRRSSLSDVLKVSSQKTAYYSFAYPLSFGARLAGHHELAKKLFTIGLGLGLLYQIENDLTPYRSKTGPFEDIINRTPNIVLTHAFRYHPEIRKLLQRKSELNKQEVRLIYRKIISGPTLPKIYSQAQKELARIGHDTMKLPVRLSMRRRFVLLQQSIFRAINDYENC